MDHYVTHKNIYTHIGTEYIIHTQIHAFIPPHNYIYGYFYIHVYIHAYAPTYIHVYIHPYIQMHSETEYTGEIGLIGKVTEREKKWREVMDGKFI